MNSTEETRRSRLKDWFSSRSIPAKEKSYISQLLNGKAPFGEKAARRLEHTYGMGDLYLDTPEATTPVRETTAPYLVHPSVVSERPDIDDHQADMERFFSTLEVLCASMQSVPSAVLESIVRAMREKTDTPLGGSRKTTEAFERTGTAEPEITPTQEERRADRGDDTEQA